MQSSTAIIIVALFTLRRSKSDGPLSAKSSRSRDERAFLSNSVAIYYFAVSEEVELSPVIFLPVSCSM